MNFRSRSPLVQPVMMRGSVQGFGFGFPDIEEQSMLAAKTGAKAKTVSDGFRKGCSAPTAADSIHDIGNGLMELMNCSSWPVQTQVSIFMQQQSGSHHSVSP